MRTNHSLHNRVVLVDIENLACSPSPSCTDVAQIHGMLHTIFGSTNDTFFEVACSHHAAGIVRYNFPEGRHQWASGPNGADLALLDILAGESIADRFTEVVIASGDGIFADAVAELAAQGVTCTVIAWSDRLSKRLRLAAHHVILLDHLDLKEDRPDAA